MWGLTPRVTLGTTPAVTPGDITGSALAAPWMVLVPRDYPVVSGATDTPPARLRAEVRDLTREFLAPGISA
jgi:hypothetical protein